MTISHLDRYTPPPISPILNIPLPPTTAIEMPHGLTAHGISTPHYEVCMVKFVFKAGKWSEPQHLVSALTNRMLREGTSQYSAHQIADIVEYYGASLHCSSSNHFSEVGIYTLGRHLPELMPILMDILQHPIFPNKELKTVLRNSKQNLKVSNKKTEYVADMLINSLVFGEHHPYGYVPISSDYDIITADILQAFHQTHYYLPQASVYLAGNYVPYLSAIQEGVLKASVPAPPQAYVEKEIPRFEFMPIQKYVEMPKSKQTSLRLATPFVNKQHPDFQVLFVLNTLLGGYFGSRLVQNIREEKGYTYGIYSMMTAYKNSGALTISTETGNEVWHKVVLEIQREIEKLQQDPVSEDELNTTKNYLLGALLSDIDGAFNIANMWQSIIELQLPNNHYEQFIDTIRSITPQQLQDLAQRYLQFEQFTQLAVGS